MAMNKKRSNERRTYRTKAKTKKVQYFVGRYMRSWFNSFSLLKKHDLFPHSPKKSFHFIISGFERAYEFETKKLRYILTVFVFSMKNSVVFWGEAYKSVVLFQFVHDMDVAMWNSKHWAVRNVIPFSFSVYAVHTFYNLIQNQDI